MALWGPDSYGQLYMLRFLYFKQIPEDVFNDLHMFSVSYLSQAQNHICGKPFAILK